MSDHFDKVKLGASYNEIKGAWGEPDKEFVCGACRNDIILMYNLKFGIMPIVFKFDNKTKKSSL